MLHHPESVSVWHKWAFQEVVMKDTVYSDYMVTKILKQEWWADSCRCCTFSYHMLMEKTQCQGSLKPLKQNAVKFILFEHRI